MLVINLVFIDQFQLKKKNKVKMVFKEKRKVFNAKKVYKGLSNPTKI